MAVNKKFIVKNGLTTQNISFVDNVANSTNTITATMLDSDTLSFSGDSGQLFSITDSQSGTIFAVNDISGVPSIEVDDDGTIRFAETFGNVLIGTSTDDGNNKLQVNGNVSLNTSFQRSIVFANNLANYSASAGELYWNPDDRTLDLETGGTLLQIGQEQYYLIKNQTGNTIPDGQAVMAAGTLGSSGRILGTPAISNGSFPSEYFMGVATETIPNGEDGFITSFGLVRGIDTGMFSEGDILYADPSVAGGLSNTAPSAPNNLITAAIVISSSNTSGSIFVRPSFGYKLQNLEDVVLNNIQNGDIITWASSNTRFEAVSANVAIDNRVTKSFVDALNVDADTLDGNDSTYYRNATNINAGTLASARLPDLTVSDFSAAAIQTGSEGFVDSDTVLMTAAAVQDKILSYGYTTTTGTVTSVGITAGSLIDVSGSPVTTSGSITVSVDLSELTTSISDGDGDYFVVVDTSNAQRKLTKGNINISGFNNDAGYTTNIGDITEVTAGSGLSGGGTSGSVTLSHADTSSQASVNNSGTTVIQDITLDTYGHITAIGSTTLSIPSAYTDSDVDTHLNTGTATSSQILSWTGSDYDWVDAAGGLTISNDTSTDATRYITFSDQTSSTEDTLGVSSTKLTFNPSTGTLSATNFNSTSDIRYKKDIVKIEDALDKVSQLNGYTFTFIDNDKKSIGLIAQELENVIPEAVDGTNEHKTVAYGNLVGLLVEAIKDQQTQINKLKSSIALLSKK